MTQRNVAGEAEFDAFAEDYDEALEKGISVSGENKNYFAQGRTRWLARRLGEVPATVQSVLDYGCGTGSASPFIAEDLKASKILGIDISKQSISVAQKTVGSDTVRFETLEEYRPDGTFDLAFCNGVFHHIPPSDREFAVKQVVDSLRPGGYFALWENNPWNPGTRYVMSRIPFDRDAITLTPPETRRLVAKAGLQVVKTDFLFIFPNFLRFLRGLEPTLCSLPLGTQYMVLSVKP